MNDPKTIENTQSNDNHSKKARHLITDENYQTLLAVQNDIYQRTEVTPAMRKLINLIIENANLDKIREQLIAAYQ